MSKKQFSKNIELSSKLAKYFVLNPSLKIPKGVSFVVFSAKDKSLNKMNEKLFKKLQEGGKKVVKAKETKDKEKPWAFTPSFI